MDAPALVVFDLGSNAIKYTVFDNNSLEILEKDRVETKNRGLDDHHNISDNYLDEIIDIVEKMVAKIKNNIELYNIICVGTQVYRNAKNSQDVISHFQQKFGFPLHIISQTTEAKLEKLGVQTSPALRDYTNHSVMLVDFGGGSTEFSWLFSDRQSQGVPVGKNDFLHDTSMAFFKQKFDQHITLDPTPDIFIVAGSTACFYASCLQKITLESNQPLEGFPLTACPQLPEICTSERDRWTASIGANLVQYLSAFHPKKLLLTTYGIRHGIAFAWKNNLDIAKM